MTKLAGGAGAPDPGVGPGRCREGIVLMPTIALMAEMENFA